MTAYERLGEILDGQDIAKIRTGAGWSSAHVHDGEPRTVTVRGNVVVRAWSDGRVELDSCGYHTLTTSAAMRLAVPGVVSVKGVYRYDGRPFEVEGNRERLSL